MDRPHDQTASQENLERSCQHLVGDTVDAALEVVKLPSPLVEIDDDQSGPLEIYAGKISDAQETPLRPYPTISRLRP